MSLDDLLNRLISVEDEADGIVAAANDEARDILADARKKASEAESSGHEADAKDAEDIISNAVSKAEREKEIQLEKAAEEHKAQANAFREKLLGRQKLAVDALLGI